MAIDSKYGRVTLERGTIGEDEPVVVFRAADALLPNVLDDYYRRARLAGCGSDHLDAIRRAADAVMTWQLQHPVKLPDSEGADHAV